MLKIISIQKWTTLARSRPVARSIVWLISRRPEGVKAENYTMRIAAKRSCPLYGLEGSNPNFLMDYEGFGARSGEVDGFLEGFWCMFRSS